MAHHDYPVGWTSPVSAGHVPGEDEYELLWDQVVASINGDDGGTWAPSAFITVGGSGFQFTGTGHSLAASARLTVQSTGEIRVADGGQIKLNGTGSADIDLKVTSGVALIDAENGSAIRIKSGASLDIFGAFAPKSGSTSQWESGATAVFASGSALTMSSGATVTLGTTMTVSGSGQVLISSTGNVTVAGSGQVTGAPGSIMSWLGSATFADLTLSGASSWVQFTTARDVTRAAKKVVPLTFNDGADFGPSDPDAWETRSPLGTPCFLTRPATSAGKVSVLEFEELPIGAVITGAVVNTGGTVPGSVASTLPTYQIVSWASGLDVFSTHSTATPDAAPSQLAFATLVTETEIAATGTTNDRTVVAGRRYGLLVTHPYESVLTQGVRIYDANIEATVAVMKL